MNVESIFQPVIEYEIGHSVVIDIGEGERFGICDRDEIDEIRVWVHELSEMTVLQIVKEDLREQDIRVDPRTGRYYTKLPHALVSLHTDSWLEFPSQNKLIYVSPEEYWEYLLHDTKEKKNSQVQRTRI